MRQIVLDTETTGLEAERGHRIIEIGCVEMINRRPSGRVFHHYLHPDREIDPGAAAVHGITLAQLADKPRFMQIAEEFIAFVDGAELIIHNAPFDIGFLDSEFKRVPPVPGGEPLRMRTRCRVLDTLALARAMHPGQRNGLDALCKRYSVDNSHRDLHGALLDARILADVYLAMTGGQSALALDEATRGALVDAVATLPLERPHAILTVIVPTADELAAHQRMLALIAKASNGRTVWREQGP